MGTETQEKVISERRRFLLTSLKGLGVAAVGGVLWGGHIEAGKAAPLVLRPPGALAERDFLARCIKCGLCIEACPYGALVLARPGDKSPIGTPYFVPRDKPCYMCRDIPCVPACPTGALARSNVSEKDDGERERLNIDLARMGIAVIDRDTCIAYSGIQCDACYRVCPRIDKAITVEYTRIERTGKHALLAPVVHSDSCTGCGLCERACVTLKASVFVLPRDVAMGLSNPSYVKGWDAKDEERLKEVPEEVITKTPRSEKAPLDYLNKGDL